MISGLGTFSMLGSTACALKSPMLEMFACAAFEQLLGACGTCTDRILTSDFKLSFLLFLEQVYASHVSPASSA